MKNPSHSDTKEDDLWRSFFTRFQSLSLDRTVHTFHLRLANQDLLLRIIGEKLAKKFPQAMAHLLVSQPRLRPALTIHLWDESITEDSPLAISLVDVFHKSQYFGDHIAAHDRRSNLLAFQTPQAITLLNQKARAIFGAITTTDALSDYELGKPLQPLLFAWMHQYRMIPVHAGLIAYRQQGILLGGAGGSGKSTVALTALLRGRYHFLSDDYVAISVDHDDPPIGYSLYNSAWLTKKQSQQFPELASCPSLSSSEDAKKQAFFLWNDRPERIITETPLNCLLLPRVTERVHTRLRPASASEALLRLAPSSILQLLFTEPALSLSGMAKLLHSIPAYWLEMGP
ncbi:hypothetical protein ACQZV8_20745, partial [Magnetococcales bacterium HHB-1]